MVYKKILVGIDRSPLGDAVFEQALSIASLEKANLMLFSSVPIENTSMGSYTNLYGEELVNFSQAIQEQLQEEMNALTKWLAEYEKKAAQQGISAQSELRMGSPESSLRELAITWGADLIVVGRRGRKGLAEVLLGSVSNYIVHHAPCSVLVVQGIPTSTDPTTENN